MDLVNRALVFATRAHAAIGQTRKFTDEPYIVHPIEVMMLVRSAGGSEAMQAAALLHDVIEDTPVSAEALGAEFGEEVLGLVLELTAPDHPGDRAARKAAECERLAGISAEAQTIKLADVISNCRTVAERDADFAAVYLPEKAAVLAVLTRGSPTLAAQAQALFTGVC